MPCNSSKMNKQERTLGLLLLEGCSHTNLNPKTAICLLAQGRSIVDGSGSKRQLRPPRAIPLLTLPVQSVRPDLINIPLFPFWRKPQGKPILLDTHMCTLIKGSMAASKGPSYLYQKRNRRNAAYSKAAGTQQQNAAGTANQKAKAEFWFLGVLQSWIAPRGN